ncbi:hypothetical protein AJ79_06309 [Helicocarpus griseus UAMH5409]|uniref:MalT-like TPR region domain-containing protein n=1 Tax=Helicocarpus griseus UAMH5409 TaxID=1447875 RepID=A0A2B7XFI6_9EURO|nr:hypothetical protein AJ79_06309 [Helicocarpus griseus UAMH5409]
MAYLITLKKIINDHSAAAAFLFYMSCVAKKGIPKFIIPELEDEAEFLRSLHVLQSYSLVTADSMNETFKTQHLAHQFSRVWLIKGDFELIKDYVEIILKKLWEQVEEDPDQTAWMEYLPHILEALSISYVLRGRARHGRNSLIDWPAMFQKKVVLAYHAAKVGSVSLLEEAKRAEVYLDIGKYGIEHYWGKYIIGRLQELLVEDDEVTLSARSGLALTCCHLQLWQKAEEIQRKVLDSRRRIWGPEDPTTLASMADLVSIYAKRGYWNKSEELNEQCLTIRKRVLGEKHPDTLSSMAYKALIYRDQGMLKEADRMETNVFTLSSRAFEFFDPATLTILTNRGRTLLLLGQWENAEGLLCQSVCGRKRTLGTEYPETLTSMTLLAFTYKKMAHWQDAMKLLKTLVKINGEVLGAKHPVTLYCKQFFKDLVMRLAVWG